MNLLLAEFRKAAHAGTAAAQFDFGVMYIDGYGVIQDYVSAHMWINFAASKAFGEDQKEFAKARDTLAGLMSPAQIAEAQKLARDWKPTPKSKAE